MAWYRNRTTGKVSFHPKSGLGDTFNADEIEDTGKPVKPRTSLAPSKEEIAAAKALLKDNTISPLERNAAEALIERGTPKTAAPKTGSGSTKTEGAD